MLLWTELYNLLLRRAGFLVIGINVILNDVGTAR